MELDEILRRLRVDGFYVVEGVIPADRIDEVRDSVLEVQARKQAELEAGETRTRSRGHRVGVAGVTNVTQVLNETQTFAPYLTDERILGAAEAVLDSSCGSLRRAVSSTTRATSAGTGTRTGRTTKPTRRTSVPPILTR